MGFAALDNREISRGVEDLAMEEPRTQTALRCFREGTILRIHLPSRGSKSLISATLYSKSAWAIVRIFIEAS